MGITLTEFADMQGPVRVTSTAEFASEQKVGSKWWIITLCTAVQIMHCNGLPTVLICNSLAVCRVGP